VLANQHWYELFLITSSSDVSNLLLFFHWLTARGCVRHISHVGSAAILYKVHHLICPSNHLLLDLPLLFLPSVLLKRTCFSNNNLKYFAYIRC